MIVTFDTEDPKVVELIEQFLREHIGQRMLSVLSCATHTEAQLREGWRSGLFLTDAQVINIRRIATDEDNLRECTSTYAQLLTKKLLEKLHLHLRTSDVVTPAEQADYMNMLINWITATIKSQDPAAIEAICGLWDDESWESIQEKLATEVSTWHVWWMDGVRRYIAIDRGWITDAVPSSISSPEKEHGPHNSQ